MSCQVRKAFRTLKMVPKEDSAARLVQRTTGSPDVSEGEGNKTDDDEWEVQK
jgi:hypothetical protein